MQYTYINVLIVELYFVAYFALPTPIVIRICKESWELKNHTSEKSKICIDLRIFVRNKNYSFVRAMK